MKNSTLPLFIAFTLAFTAYTHLDMKEREKQAVKYINTHSDGTDQSIYDALQKAKDIYNLPPYLVEELEYSFYL